MNIAIVDDVEEERIRLKTCLDQYAQAKCLQFDIHMFENADSLLKSYRPMLYTVIFLDIFMPGSSGIEAAEAIRKTDKDTTLIFLTESMDHMPEAFSFHAYDYIQKPADLPRISRLMDDIIRQDAVSQKSFAFICDRESMSLPYSDIIALCSSGHYLEIIDKDGKHYKTRTTFNTVQDKLSDEKRFLLINRGAIVNMDHILEFKDGVCCLEDGVSIPANTRKEKDIERIWHNYLFSKVRNRSMERRNR